VRDEVQALVGESLAVARDVGFREVVHRDARHHGADDAGAVRGLGEREGHVGVHEQHEALELLGGAQRVVGELVRELEGERAEHGDEQAEEDGADADGEEAAQRAEDRDRRHLLLEEAHERAVQHDGHCVVDDGLAVHERVERRLDLERAEDGERGDGVHCAASNK